MAFCSNSGFGRLVDTDVIYTGPSITCGGITVNPGDTVREFISVVFLCANDIVVNVEGNSLPIPDGTGSKVAFVGSGTYTQSGGPDIVVPSGNIGILFWDGSVWSLSQSVEFNFVADGEIEEGDHRAVSGDTVFSFVDPAVYIGENLVDSNDFRSGFIRDSGAHGPSDNQICITKSVVPEEVKGQDITISGGGTVPSNSLAFCAYDSDGVVLYALAGEGSDTFPVTVEVPQNADTWSFTIANKIDVGLNPHNNEFVKSFMVNLGDTPKNFEPYGTLLNVDRLDNPDDIEFNNSITENGSGAVPSKKIYPIVKTIAEVTKESDNLIDTLVLESGTIVHSTGNPVPSINQVRIPYVDVPNHILGQEVTISGNGNVSSSAALVAIRDSGGNVIFKKEGNGWDSSPFTFEVPLDSDKWAFAVSNELGIGNDPLSSVYVDTFMVNLGDTPKNFEPYGTLLRSDKLDVKIEPVEYREVFVNKINNELIHIFLKTGASDDSWLRVNLMKQVNASKFIDLWRLDRGWAVTKVGEGFTTDFQVVNAGVYENAIYTSGSGYSDAIGGSHGWEMIEEFRLYIDGVEIDFDTFDSVGGREFSFTTLTNYKTVNGDGNIGKSFKKWVFSNGKFSIENNIEWLGVINVASNSYLSMLSIFRKNAQDMQITHSGNSNEDGVTYDISEPGFENRLYSDKTNPNRIKLTVWGDEVKAEMESIRFVRLDNGDVLPFGLPDAGMFVQNSETPSYNKMYGSFGSMTTSEGDFFRCVTNYSIKIRS